MKKTKINQKIKMIFLGHIRKLFSDFQNNFLKYSNLLETSLKR